ncbi:MAG: AI-2E family transporter [Polyangia bacterium]
MVTLSTPAAPSMRRKVFTYALPVFILAVLVAFRTVVMPFVLGVLVAYLLAPPVRAISEVRVGRSRVPRWIGVLFVYVTIAAAIAIFLLTLLPRVSTDFARLFREAPRFMQKVRTEYVPQADAWLEQRFDSARLEAPPKSRRILVTQKRPGQFEIDLDELELEIDPVGKGRYIIAPRDDNDEPKGRVSDLLAQMTRSTESEMRSVVSVGQRFLRGVVRAFAWFVLTFMVAAYLLIDAERVLAFFRSLVTVNRRAEFDELVTEIDRGLSGVVRGQLLICAVNGLLTTVGLVLFRVKYALLLGIVAALMSFIPVFGSILSSVPIVAIALASGQEGVSMSTGVGVLLWIVGIHFLEANLFNPRIIGSAAKMHPVIVVFALLVGEETGGIIGALIAVPTASIVQAVFLWTRRRSLVG